MWNKYYFYCIYLAFELKCENDAIFSPQTHGPVCSGWCTSAWAVCVQKRFSVMNNSIMVSVSARSLSSQERDTFAQFALSQQNGFKHSPRFSVVLLMAYPLRSARIKLLRRLFSFVLRAYQHHRSFGNRECYVCAPFVYIISLSSMRELCSLILLATLHRHHCCRWCIFFRSILSSLLHRNATLDADSVVALFCYVFRLNI